MGFKSEMITARDEFIDLVKAELFGPGSEVSIPDAEHELITTVPEKRYSIGILFPRENKMQADGNDVDRAVQEDENKDLEETVDFDDSDYVVKSVTVNKKELKEDEESDDDPDSEDNLDEEVSFAAQNMPSSFGITFFVKGSTDHIRISLKYGVYRNAHVEDCRIPFIPSKSGEWIAPNGFDRYVKYDRNEKTLRLISGINRKTVRELKERNLLDRDEDKLIDNMYKLAAQLQNGYVRKPRELKYEIVFGDKDYVSESQIKDHELVEITALKRKMENGTTSITIMVVNTQSGYPRSNNCIFQPELIVNSVDNEFSFEKYSGVTNFDLLDDEEQSIELQYRNKKVYGTGLGTAIDWNINEKGEGFIRSDFFPEFEVPSMDFELPRGCGVRERTLSMKYLSDLDETEKKVKIRDLENLVNAYSVWIDNLVTRSHSLESYFSKAADRNLGGCRNACERMKNGIRILERNNMAWDAFQLANRAMFMQRIQLAIQREYPATYPDEKVLSGVLKNIDYRTADETFSKDKYAWRPFQLAFMLLDIASVIDDNSEDRSLVDLIWFPTGGGKTEAYLGLTAMTIFYRRFCYPDESGGTTVIMRYTLRLLAAQQFTRASTLICACEFIRKDCELKKSQYKNYVLGKLPITIGLWIGGEHTPNTNNNAKKNLEKLRSATAYNNLEYAKDTYNKFQVLKCPWCGTRMTPEREENKKIRGTFGYKMHNGSRFALCCTRQACPFGNMLPIQVVDEELYREAPTLLFGTVDKFAMLPWNNQIGNFFALNSKNRAPELIIQDELHLISGPLGTMVGLYESAVDALCRRKGNLTKIVASTATIRHAVEQCAALYDRDVSQFPHPALDAEDSFFAREKKIDYEKEKFGRKYVGLMPSGKTKAMMEIRSMAAMLQKVKDMDVNDEVKDKLWTLTAYYNSLKDLGKASTMVDDDVKDFMKRMCYRLKSNAEVRKIGTADELTSRVSTTQLNQTLDKLEKNKYSTVNVKNHMPPYPCNVLLATNMISVGIDVARLNVMLLVGQPKLTSEYIQASSRVGREYPGVAFTMYDGGKSRDRSHYEQFRSYHESFYRHVEPTGATPFSAPARKRALHAVLIAYIRLSVGELSGEDDAIKFQKKKYEKAIKEVSEYMIKRCIDVNRRINIDVEDDSYNLKEEMKNILEKWDYLATNAEETFCYGKKFMIKSPDVMGKRLMKTFGAFRDDPAFETMTSMRNVDVMIPGSIIEWKEDDEDGR